MVMKSGALYMPRSDLLQLMLWECIGIASKERGRIHSDQALSRDAHTYLDTSILEFDHLISIHCESCESRIATL